MNNWTLVNAEQRSKDSPETFHIPDRQTRENLNRGSLVKLTFELSEDDSREMSGERLWVEVTSITPTGYIGRIDNDPRIIKDLQCNDIVEFKPEHITSIWED